MNVLFINIFDIQIRVETDSDFIFENLAKDFALFRVQQPITQSPSITLSVLLEAPPYHRVPRLVAALYGNELICYKDKNINYVTYSCGALLIYDFAREKGELFGKDELFLYEKTKLTILSRVGELLDQRGLHRVHAFAFSVYGKTLMCLLPMQSGKTTTILNLIKTNADVKIIADDVCFIDRHGTIYPFLLRLGARDGELIEGIPDSYVTPIDRPYYGLKYFIDPQFFQTRIAGGPQRLTHILIGRRIFCQETTIEKIKKYKCFMPMVESGVFGMGLPQLLEFFVRGDFRLLSSRIKIIISRIFFCVFLLGKTKTFVIKIGLDKEKTCKKILEFLEPASR